MSCVQSSKAVEETFAKLEDESGEVDFTGFMTIVASLAIGFKSVLDDQIKQTE